MSGGDEVRTPLGPNPGWAGETGEFSHLTEADVRGTDYVGRRSPAGGHPGASCSLPFQIAQRNQEAPLFEGPYAERLEKIRSRYPEPRGALLPVLGMAQEIRGHLSEDTMAEVAALLELSPAAVRGVATFYTMYNKRPVGRYFIQVCTNVSCSVCAADDVMEAFVDAVGVDPGEISEDGLFTVIEAECLGACGFPTAVQINEFYYENVEPGDVSAIIDRLRAEAEQAEGKAGEG